MDRFVWRFYETSKNKDITCIRARWISTSYLYSTRKHKLEDHVKSAQDNLTKLMVVTGPTKSGKTVLVNKIFPQDSAIWIDGGMITDEQSFWDLVVEKLNVFTRTEYAESGSDSSEIQGTITAEGNILFAP